MASLPNRLSPLHPSTLLPTLSTKSVFPKRIFQKRRHNSVVVAIVKDGTYPMTAVDRERKRMRQKFDEAFLRCRNDPMEGVSFTEEEMLAALEKGVRSYRESAEESVVPATGGAAPAEVQDREKFEVDLEEAWHFSVGETVHGLVYLVQDERAFVDIGAKSFAILPLENACIFQVETMAEAGIYPGFSNEFIVSGRDRKGDGTYTVSLKETLYELAWERCRQLQAEDAPLIGKVVGGNSGGMVTIVEGLNGFIPFSQISMKDAEIEDLMGVKLPLKIVEVDQEQTRLVLSNRKAIADSQAQLSIGSVVVGTVESIKPYGAFIDIGGINGLLHVSQISHDRVTDVSTVLQPGDTLKVMILSHDRERGRVSLSTKKLEPTPGDMIRNPTIVFEKADEMAQIFRQRIAQAEAMARADMLRFQPESGLSLSSDGLLGPLSSYLPEENVDFGGIPPA